MFKLSPLVHAANNNTRNPFNDLNLVIQGKHKFRAV